MIIEFNKPLYIGNEDEYVLDAMRSNKMSGDGKYGKLCEEWFERKLGSSRCMFTPSCTHALEMAALLLDIKSTDEVIMPSYTFVSTANAFALRGASIKFVDIRPETMNINESLIEAAITSKTKAIVPVHYAGVGCDMDVIMKLAEKYQLIVIEDAAQGMMSTYMDKHLGSIGHLATYSFHETKNFTSGGEGGLLLINDKKFIERAEIIREKGTNRNNFFRGIVDKYTWMDIGSSYLPSELQAAYLWGQLQKTEQITIDRLENWNLYKKGLIKLESSKKIELPVVPLKCKHNGHIFFIKCANLEERTKLMYYLKSKNISSVFHYVPLHSAPAGNILGSFVGDDRYTTLESERILRLPLWYGISKEKIQIIIKNINEFYE
jgi:dTDP-4-amino-4,6-dideoxygalactose transaminase